MTNWSWNFAVVMWTPPMLTAIGGFGTFLFFGVINLCFFPFIYLFYVETRGRSLEEIDIIFAKAYSNGEWYVKTGNEMPSLSEHEIEKAAVQYGLATDREKQRHDFEHPASVLEEHSQGHRGEKGRQ